MSRPASSATCSPQARSIKISADHCQAAAGQGHRRLPLHRDAGQRGADSIWRAAPFSPNKAAATVSRDPGPLPASENRCTRVMRSLGVLAFAMSRFHSRSHDQEWGLLSRLQCDPFGLRPSSLRMRGITADRARFRRPSARARLPRV
jgi:hypothetical protein